MLPEGPRRSLSSPLGVSGAFQSRHRAPPAPRGMESIREPERAAAVAVVAAVLAGGLRGMWTAIVEGRGVLVPLDAVGPGAVEAGGHRSNPIRASWCRRHGEE